MNRACPIAGHGYIDIYRSLMYRWWEKMRSIHFGRVRDSMITKSPKFFSFYLELFGWYFEIIL